MPRNYLDESMELTHPVNFSLAELEGCCEKLGLMKEIKTKKQQDKEKARKILWKIYTKLKIASQGCG